MMKIVAGLGSIDEYIPYAQAGADEFFCGYVPASWTEKYGTLQSLNRREVRNVNVQLGAMEELKILKNMMDSVGVPVKLTFNSLFYTKAQYQEIAEIIKQCMDAGFHTFIIADPALIIYLREKKIGETSIGQKCKIHLSGEMTEINSFFLKDASRYDIQRVIFHRKNTYADMKSCIAQCKNIIPEYEAFVLNEMCHFTGAYCNSLHCDELSHMCLVPYELGTYDEEKGAKCSGVNTLDIQNGVSEDEEIQDDYITGSTGCGLCGLYQLEAAGVTHLKVVGRGNHIDFMKRDIAQVKRALQILAEVKGNNEIDAGGNGAESAKQAEKLFMQRIQKELFTGRCSKNCYYR